MTDITPKEAIANLNHLYGMVSPDMQRSLDVAIKALERPQGDCISRSDLKKEVVGMMINKADDLEEVEFEINSALASVCEKIDNAQAVDLWQMRQEATENALKKAEVLYDRPKGEWLFKHNSSDIWCSVCDENFDEIPQAFNFCPNCGADMRKGGAE